MHMLHLLRHAKSSWKDAELADHDRPLNERGRQSARLLADHLRRAGVAPDLVLCSTALRTRQTLDFIMTAIKPPLVALEQRLYESGRSRLLQRLRLVGEEFGCVLLIAHNPGLHDLALALAAPSESDILERLRDKFPTAALASYRFAGTWHDLAPQQAKLTAYVTPRSLGSGAEED
jgi:phosphohistidine phosphatase